MSSREVENATGEAPARENVIELLAEKRAARDAAKARKKAAREMRDEEALSDESRLLDSLDQIIAELEIEAAVVIEAAARKEAEDRQLGIRRAAGSIRTEVSEDDQRIRALEKEIGEVNAKRTVRVRKYESYQAEANSLSDRFGLPPLKLETLAEPPAIEVPASWRHHIVRPSFEETKDGTRRTRRDYAEIRASAGFAIIMRAGLRPFRELTEEEKEFLDREDKRQPDPIFAQAAIEANALGNLGVPGGGVARG